MLTEKPDLLQTTDPIAGPAAPGRTVIRSDIRASAVRILYLYFLPGSEQQILLPENIQIRIIHQIKEEGRDDPEVFDDAKDYVSLAMARDAFPRFLKRRRVIWSSIRWANYRGLNSLNSGRFQTIAE